MGGLRVLQTFLSRVSILGFSFGLVILSTNLWGSEGKGIISIAVADLVLITFISNIFTGSAVSYFARRYQKEQILSYAWSWAIISGLLVAFIFASIFPPPVPIEYLAGVSVITSLLSANINLFVGLGQLKKFNLYTLLQQGGHWAVLLAFVFFAGAGHVEYYFAAQIVASIILFAFTAVQLLENASLSAFALPKKLGYEMLRYGWNTQASLFLNFLNQRLSYYFLEFFRGLPAVGVLSVGVAISEAVWMASRSLSLVLYSDIVGGTNDAAIITKTKFSLKVSFWLTAVLLTVLLLFPEEIFKIIFGQDFHQTKQIIILLAPGVLAVACSNVIGYYFAGINELKILNIKSLVGLIFTLILSFVMIPNYGALGAAASTSAAYCASSLVLAWKFYSDIPFKTADFLFSKKELQLIFSKIRPKSKTR